VNEGAFSAILIIVNLIAPLMVVYLFAKDFLNPEEEKEEENEFKTQEMRTLENPAFQENK